MYLDISFFKQYLFFIIYSNQILIYGLVFDVVMV